MIALQAVELEVAAVQEALSALRQALPLRADHPLATFLSVQDQALAAALSGRAVAELCIAETLSARICCQLKRHRVLHNPRRFRLAPSQRDLQRDFQAESPELEGWSLLYFRYVCVELDLSIEQIAGLVGQTRRTLQRR